MMEIRLLGPVEVWRGGLQVAAGSPKQRCVLAVLALEPNRVVPVDALIDRIWDIDPPEAARALISTYIARLRKVFTSSDVTLTNRSGGYVLAISPEQIDLHRFRSLLADARKSGEPETIHAALGLWRGLPLSGLDGEWPRRVRVSLAREQLLAQQQLIDSQLRAGRPEGVLGQLDDLLAENPLDEKLIELRMLALYRAGRHAEALSCFRTARTRFLEELGDEPGPGLRELHQRLLNRDPALSPPPVRDTPPAVRTEQVGPVPHQLPAHTPHFVGRADEIRQLSDVVDTVDDSVAIVTIGGPAGIGKTALAVRWAHHVADRFPDGQLYVNLRGFDPTGRPVTPVESIRGFLNAFQVPPDRIPDNAEAQAGLYRSLLSKRKVLVLLDNVRDPDQVRPLLPASPGCLALITSRNQLAGLIAQEGARPITLTVLSTDEAGALLHDRLGADRLRAEPEAVAELIERCARLPLALAIAAARAALNPHLPLRVLADELGDEQTRLDALNAGDTSVHATFSWSYQHLAAPVARMFRLLGLHPGPDVSPAAAASLACVPVRQAREATKELVRAHLMVEHVPGRFAFHDLLRAYANDQAQAQDTVAERQQAVRRALDHYLHSTHNAARLLNPHRDPITMEAPAPGVVIEQPADDGEALAWYETERQVLLAAVQQAADAGLTTHAWQLPWTLVTFCYRRGHWHDWLTVQHTALTAAERGGDHVARAHANRDLGRVCTRVGNYEDARHHLTQALELERALDNPAGQAQTHIALAGLFDRLGHHDEALRHAEQALHQYHAVGDQPGIADALNALAWEHAQLGEYRQALDHSQQSLALHLRLGNRNGAADTWDSVAYAHHHLGNFADAIACYQRAVELCQEFGDDYNLAGTLARLGDTHHAAGNSDAARAAWRRALDILDDPGLPDTDRIRTKLLNLTPGATSAATGTTPA